MLKYGLVGSNVSLSSSKYIHESLTDMNYELLSLVDEGHARYFFTTDFIGVNVTVPYKTLAASLCDNLSEEAIITNTVNVVIKKDNKLNGYNTDIYGFEHLLNINNIEIKDKVCLIMGTGASSRTIKYVLEKKHAKEIKFLSRNPDGINSFSYKDINLLKTADVIINATPVGKDSIDDKCCLIDFNKLEGLDWFIDINSRYMTYQALKAKESGIKTVCGMQMLVAQAVKSNELFFDRIYDEKCIDEIYHKLINISVIGHPFSGKTTIGKSLADSLGMKFIDIDNEIENIYQMTIPNIFDKYGEEHFRYIESNVIKNAIMTKGAVISLGGGSTLNLDNIRYIKMSSKIVCLNRDINLIESFEGRPLSKSKEELIKLIENRKPYYTNIADIEIENNTSIEDAVNKIRGAL